MIKVLNIVSDTNIGGAGRVIINYLKYRDRENFDVSVILPRGSLLKERIEELGVPVYEIDAMADKSFDRAAIKLLKREIKRIDPHIVHTHGSLSGRIAARRCGRKIVYTRHTSFPATAREKSLPMRMLNKIINEHYTNRIIAISPATFEDLTDRGISPGIIDVMMNGVEPVERLSAEECAAVRQEYGVGPEDKVISILARIEEYKGHLDILDAAATLKDRGLKFKLIIAGTGSFEDAVRERAEKLRLGDFVVFAGFVENVSRVLSITDVQINASYMTETSSLSLLEGMSMGIPAVVSDCSGNPWVIEDGVNGLLFPPRDSGAMADAVEKLLSDGGLYEKLSAGALSAYGEKFTGEAAAGNIENTYYKMMKGK